MSFKRKKLGDFKKYNGFLDFFLGFFQPIFLSKLLLIVVSFSLIIYFSTFAFDFGKKIVGKVSTFSLNVVSESIGKEIKKDELGQFNILLAGYGGENKQGGLLTDTMMVASYNPKLETVTFLSIPRDLYVEKNGYSGKLNGLFANYYFYQDKNISTSARHLMDKISEITDISLDYYAFVNFDGFKNLINKLGGVKVDVPEAIVDNEYPRAGYDGYTTFKISKGTHILSGEKALKYARSRHSTSDFSRSLRQQQIIKGIIGSLLEVENLTNIDKLKSLYGEYKNVVKTNINFKEILGMAKYINNLENFYTFVYNASCYNKNFDKFDPGCFLYFPPRNWFGGMSVLLPKGASDTNLDYYKDLKDFAFLVIHNQKFLLENANIKILNGIDRGLLHQEYGYAYPAATKFAETLSKYAFNITDVGNSEKSYDETFIYKNGTGDYSTTINAMKMFTDVDKVLTGNNKFNNDLTVVLGNDYLK